MRDRNCARCKWRSTSEPVDMTDGCLCACHVDGAVSPPCDIEGGCGTTHLQELSPDAQAALHAIEQGHPLCILCYRSLAEAERQTCERCIAEAQTHLSGVRMLYDELPLHLRMLSSNGLSGSRDGRPLPGGDALALLGPGSEGLSEDGKTSKDGDPVSVAFELFWWEQDWRDAREEPHNDNSPRSTARIVREAAGYLERHTRWAATSHFGFDQYARDMRALHVRLEVATFRVRPPTMVNTACFYCRGQLVRRITDAGMEAEDAVCRSCGQTYDRTQLAMARAQEYLDASMWADADGNQWATSTSLAARLGRSENTLKRWRHDGLVRVHIVDTVTFFHVGDAEAQDATRPRRNRAS
ncbi:MAG: hypothetical protein JWP11_1915 [Frankiales bacterium]|nr:hypothetical protein [Frankiales bacterium]